MMKITARANHVCLKAACLATALVGIHAFAAQTDARSSSIQCAIEKTGLQVECNYRHSPSLEVKDVSLKIADLAVQIPAKGVVAYPSGTQTTALLFLVDVSDPKRKDTVEKKNVKAIMDMLGQIKPHHKVGIAVFDSDLRALTPISTDVSAAKSAASNIKASGQATEFYKNILSAIAILQKSEATRKGLIIMSDGKAEDSAYKHEDVIKAASDAGVVILGLGYLDKPKDSPYLQKIKRLADETFGLYFDATAEGLPSTLATKPFAFVEKGGKVSFAVGDTRGKQTVTVVLRSSDGKPLELKAEIDFPDKRTKQEIALDFGKQHWPFLLAGLGILLALLAVFLRYRRIKRLASKPPEPYASLNEMDGSGTSYLLAKAVVCIGRSADNDIRLTNNSISSHHAEIHRRRAGELYIIDLASSNGVFVNDNKVTQIELHEGDLIELGEVRLRLTVK